MGRLDKVSHVGQDLVGALLRAPKSVLQVIDGGEPKVGHAVELSQGYSVAFLHDVSFVVRSAGVHSHPAHLTVLLSPAKVRMTPAGGKPQVIENQPGDVFWSEAETHEVENISGKDVRALLIELKPAPKG